MLTPEELHGLEKINLQTVKEAHAQVEKRLTDALESKKVIEQKATLLFGSYIPISLALFGFAGTLMKDPTFGLRPWPALAAGAFFVIGASCFIYALRGQEYANLGSEPSMWLVRGRIDGDDNALAEMFAYLVRDHAKKLDASFKSNRQKLRAVHAGMIIGVIGTFALFAGSVLTSVAWTNRLWCS